MFQAFYNGLSGMLSFSRNLDTVSNNISNMNTPGFRGADTFYKSLGGGEQESGNGTQISGLGYRFTSGDIRQTGNATDVAISGQGFFTLLKDGNSYYSRAGQFAFNNDGILTDSISGASVAAIDENGSVSAFDISKLRVRAPKETSSVLLNGNLSSGATTHEVSGVTVFNKLGEEVNLTLKFTKSTTDTGAWSVSVLNNSASDAVLSTETIKFGADGTPLSGQSSFTVSVPDSMGGTASVSFNLGDTGNFGQSTSTDTGTTSTLNAVVQDGSAIASLRSIDFKSDGSISLTYTNGETQAGPALALAHFKDESVLRLAGGSLFEATSEAGMTVGKAGTGSLGSIQGKSIELSNVDLSREFADMIVIQRGYQASSRLLNVSNQLLEQLYESTRGR
ncbi:flagellar basal-body rod protein FlgF [Pseudoalteromonas aurantia]|uniref:Flagellar basal-body rod protein FlgF n=1 Tax=Pseudoalteromonas aurantia TaxID=43654 RepID=A0A5S3V6B8_9GAMM|nr:flagellar basal-body rod protein FlgF [Pseudoalteromonas aurantia]TMO66635.1 flagellar basal-body rod protein FlgF [Pseudoalteromonas aurantia]